MIDSLQKQAITGLLEQIRDGKLIVDDESRIYRKLKSGELRYTENLNQYGYYRVVITIEKRSVFVFSHRLLYALYHGIDSLDENQTVHHIDHNKLNNKKII